MVVWACLCIGGASENFLLKTRYINSLFDLIWFDLVVVAVVVSAAAAAAAAVAAVVVVVTFDLQLIFWTKTTKTNVVWPLGTWPNCNLYYIYSFTLLRHIYYCLAHRIRTNNQWCSPRGQALASSHLEAKILWPWHLRSWTCALKVQALALTAVLTSFWHYRQTQ